MFMITTDSPQIKRLCENIYWHLSDIEVKPIEFRFGAKYMTLVLQKQRFEKNSRC